MLFESNLEMKIFLDESGNTGVDLLSADQPLFSLASTNLRADQCNELVTPLIRSGQKEAKYSKLKSTSRGQQALLGFFSSPTLNNATAKVMLADKRYYLISHLVDKLIEPTLYERGIDLYAGDAHVGLTNVWYYAGHTIFINGNWEKVLKSFLNAIRIRSSDAFAEFDAVVQKAVAQTPMESRDYAMGVWLARGRLDKFIGCYKDIEVFDPAVDIFIDMINKWMAASPDHFQVTHDQSKPLRRREAFLRLLMKPLFSRMIGYGARQTELPLRISQFDFGDSKAHPQLQVADLIAGATVDCLLTWSGRRPSSSYHEAMKDTQLESMFEGGMLPSPKIERKNEPKGGEMSLVDGSAAFLLEAGHLESRSE